MRTKGLCMTALVMVLVLSLSACSPIVEDAPQTLSLYATFYPIYALAGMVVKDIPDLELHCLVQPQDGCLRSYTLSDWDLYLLSYSANAVLSGGSGLECFSGTLESMAETQFSLIEILYGLPLYQESEDDGEDATHFDGGNPHLYMSIDGAIWMLQNIAGSLSVIDQRYADQYMKNLDTAIEELKALQAAFFEQTSVCNGKKAAVLNEALVYVAQDCQMEIVTTVERESGINLYDDELKKCIVELSESGAEIVLIEQQAPKPLIDALETAGFSVARLDILSTRSEADGIQGYFDAQMNNAQALAEACAS